jgi:hypothetical protein
LITASTNENGPGAAATAHRAEIVASSKPTGSDNPNPEAQQSAFASPDNTGKKQAASTKRLGRLSLRSAIDAMCRYCIYDPGGGNGTWREQVQACSSANCPLHPVRPITVKAKLSAENASQAAGSSDGSSLAEIRAGEGRLGRNGPTTEQRRAA